VEVKIETVQTISRKDSVNRESSETKRRAALENVEDIVRTSWRHEESRRNVVTNTYIRVSNKVA
jgi:hypothetical protein